MFASAAGLQRLLADDQAHAADGRGVGGGSDWLAHRAFALLQWEWHWPGQAAAPRPAGDDDGASRTAPAPAAAAAAARASASEAAASEAAPYVAWSPIFGPGSGATLVPRADSQDAWLFRAPLPLGAARAVADLGARFGLGAPRCDNRLAEVNGGGGQGWLVRGGGGSSADPTCRGCFTASSCVDSSS